MIVWDNHACMPLRPHDESFLPQLERVAASGVDVVGLNVGFGEQSIEEHVRMLGHFRRWISLHSERYALVGSIDDVMRAKAAGKLGIFFDIEGARAIDDQVSLIGLYYDLGVRWMLMAYNRNNRVGGGCLDEDPGLSEFGYAVIDEMERVGMIACCSHTGERTALDVIAHARNPVIFSHSNPRALWDHPRNVRDVAIEACAAKGGVVGINGVGQFLGANDTRSETFARNVDYVARLVGADHVAIGLDYVFDEQELLDFLAAMPHTFPGTAATDPCDFVKPEQLREIVAELRRLGYHDGDLAKILGGNLLRVARAVWK